MPSARIGLQMWYCAAVVVLWAYVVASSPTDSTSCVQARRIEEQFKQSKTLMQLEDSSTVLREICSSDTGVCCSDSTVPYLVAYGLKEFDTAFSRHVDLLINKLSFEEVTLEAIKEMTIASEKKLDRMFNLTYGALYNQSIIVFKQFYAHIKGVMNFGIKNIDNSVSLMFNLVGQRMVLGSNAKIELTPEMSSCVLNRIQSTKPFQQVPDQVGAQLKRSYLRMINVLNAARELRTALMKIKSFRPSPACERSITQAYSCLACVGLASQPPCPSTCLRLSQLCLEQFLSPSFRSRWSVMAGSLTSLVHQLEGHYGLAAALDGLPIMISDGIMMFHGEQQKLYDQLVTPCNVPRARSKREEVSDSHTTLSDLAFGRMPKFVNSAIGAMANATERIREAVLSLPSFWNKLHEMNCSTDQGSTCWDTSISRRREDDLAAFQPGSTFNFSTTLSRTSPSDMNAYYLHMTAAAKLADDAILLKDTDSGGLISSGQLTPPSPTLQRKDEASGGGRPKDKDQVEGSARGRDEDDGDDYGDGDGDDNYDATVPNRNDGDYSDPVPPDMWTSDELPYTLPPTRPPLDLDDQNREIGNQVITLSTPASGKDNSAGSAHCTSPILRYVASAVVLGALYLMSP